MRSTNCTTVEQDAFEHGSWTAFQATLFIAGGSIVLWAGIVSLVRWLI